MSFLKPHVEARPHEPAPPEPKATYRIPVPEHSPLDALHALGEARARAERIVASELSRMEDSFVVTLKALEDRLAATQAELSEMQRRYDQLLKNQLSNDRNLQTLRELKRVLDSV